MEEVAETSPIVMRTKEVKLSESEHEQLTNYANMEYPEGVPYGYIISDLLDEAQ